MHKDLEVYKASMELVRMVYELCKIFPKEEIYGLTSQMKRAAVSVPSNIAEGNGRKSPKELNNFLNIALGSLIELETQLDIAKMLQFSIDEMNHYAIEDQLQKAKRLLIGLIKSVQAKLCHPLPITHYLFTNDMKDFTVNAYNELLDALILSGYEFQTFKEYLRGPLDKVVILRHDVDKKPGNSLRFAEIEHDRGLEGSYFFRVVPESLQVDKLLAISKLGHEIGYHYEDMDPAKGDPEKAIKSFVQNLEKLRKLAPIDTICMHGSPLSKYDNKELWRHFDYRDYCIIGEPYFDVDYSKVFYITDTGRKWNNRDASIRDKVDGAFEIEVKSTEHFIELIKAGKMPEQMMINTHPQRWNDDLLPWVVELVGQSVKNQIKKIVSRRKK